MDANLSNEFPKMPFQHVHRAVTVNRRPYLERRRLRALTRLFVKIQLGLLCTYLVKTICEQEAVYRFLPRLVKEINRGRVDWRSMLERARSSERNTYERTDVHIYMISLPRTAGRAARALSSTHREGLNVSMFSAVDGLDPFNGSDLLRFAGRRRLQRLAKTATLGAEELLKLNKLYLTGRLSEYDRSLLHERLRFGCYLSHVRLWELTLRHVWPFVIVLEDDVEVVHNFKSRLGLALLEAPVDWGIIFLNGCYRSFGGRLNEHLILSRGGLCTYAYAISHRGVKHFMQNNLLRSSKPIDHLIDQQVSSGKLLAFHTTDDLVDTTKTSSTLAY